MILPQMWPWEVRKGSELPGEFLRYLSDPEMNADALGGQIHWSSMLEPVLTTAGGLFLCFLMISQLPGDLAGAGSILVLVMLVLIGRLAYMYWEWNRNLIFFTNKRVIAVTGVFVRNVAMLPLGKLTDMNYKRSVVGMLLGYGSFRLETAGQNQAVELLRRIPDPDGSYRHLQNLLFGRGSTDVILIDVKTQKKVNVNWRGRIFPGTGGRGASLEPADEDEWYEK